MTNRPTVSILNRALVCSFLFLVYAGAIGFGTVWLRHQIALSATENKVIERRVIQIERSLSQVNAELAVALSPDYLIARNRELNLQLARPSEDQIVRIREDIGVRLATKRNEGLFSSVERTHLQVSR
jgi:hypothetical protein